MNMRIVEAKPRGVNVIGKFHEDNTTMVKFDLREYMADFGDLNIVLVHKRNGDEIALPTLGFTVVDGIGQWIVSENDTSYAGCGEAEVQFRDDNHCRKSVTYTTMVLDSPSNGTYPPSETVKSLADDIAKMAADVISATVGYAAIKKLKQYTYEVWYDKIDYTAAFRHFRNNDDGISPAACTSIRNGNMYGRNYDLFYDDKATFVVHVPSVGNRYATTAVCGGFQKLTQAFVDSGTADKIYGILPFQALDGINEFGVCANVNVVPYDKDHEYAGPEDYDFEISANMLVRYILDYFDNATDAVEYVRDHVRVVMSKALRKMHYDVHFMVADAEHTYIIEFIGGETKVVEQDRMTNFRLYGVTLNDDGTVYTPATQDEEHDAVATNGIEEYGGGLERFNLIAEGYNECSTKTGMRAMLDELKYTNTYGAEDPIWYTEFVGGELKCNSPVDDFADIVEKAREEYASRTRDNPTTWQTVHSTVYDMASGKMYLVTQEEDEEFEFKIEIDKNSVEIDDTTTSTEKVWSSNKTNAELENKVEKVDGKGLSTNDYTNEDKDKVDNSVQMEAGKGLSTNDYTTEEKEKLGDIEEEANKTIVDTSLSDSSDNPVANRTIKAKFDDVDASLSSLNQAIQTLDSDLAEEKRKRQAMWELEEGIVYRIEDKAETGMNVAPSGAYSMSLENVQGKSEQKTTNGYQMLDLANATTETNRGIRATINADGSISYIGTATETGYVGRIMLANPMHLLAGETYTISIDNSADNGFIKLLNGWSGIVDVRSSKQYTPTNDATINAICFSVDGALTVDYTVKIMVEHGSTAHAYEPYTGGLPSPSPDYPQDIHSVEEINVKVTGKNLFDKAIPVINCRISQGTVESNNGYRTIFIPAKSGVTYHISGSLDDNVYWAYVASTDIGTETLASGSFRPINGRTAVAPQKTKYLGVSVYYTVVERAFDDLQVEIGAYTTAYEPYTEQTRVITPSRPMNGVGTLVDTANVETGKYTFNYDEPLDPTKTVAEQALETPVVEDIPAEDITFLRSLENIRADHHIFITDQDGNDVSYLLEYLVSLRGVLNNA